MTNEKGMSNEAQDMDESNSRQYNWIDHESSAMSGTQRLNSTTEL